MQNLSITSDLDLKTRVTRWQRFNGVLHVWKNNKVTFCDAQIVISEKETSPTLMVIISEGLGIKPLKLKITITDYIVSCKFLEEKIVYNLFANYKPIGTIQNNELHLELIWEGNELFFVGEKTNQHNKNN